MFFDQAPPSLGNQFQTDRVLRGYLQRVLPSDTFAAIRSELKELGRLAGGPLYALQLEDRTAEPTLTRWDAWGNRIDRIELTRVWKEAERLAAKYGLVAAGYENAHGPFARVHQLALAYLFIPSTDLYGCPLAMTDGAARTLLESGNDALIERAVPQLTSRDPERFWTSGQWMTELSGGSDVGRTRTMAREENGTWRLYGRKWFTSAITAHMALALARPEGNPSSSRGLALFFVPVRDEDDRLRPGIKVNRLKEKLGTRKLPTAELMLEGAEAVPVGDLQYGTRQIAPMLNITRTWNAVTAVAYMRRGLALARDYAEKRLAFGTSLAEHPLHVDTLAGLQATFEGAFHLTFRTVELLGQCEQGTLDAADAQLLRILTPLAKLTTAKQAVAHTSEVLECFGGAGYVEDTGLPVLLRDAQVLPIWEGTTNVLALDLLRAVDEAEGLAPVIQELQRCKQDVSAPPLQEALRRAETSLDQAGAWLLDATRRGRTALEAGARRFALTLGHALELTLLARHAQWTLETTGDERPLAATRRFVQDGIRFLGDIDPGDSRALGRDEPLDEHRAGESSG